MPFTLFGADHVAALVTTALACLAMARLATPRMGPLISAALLAYVAASYVQMARLGSLTLEYALPLHLCNIAVAITAVACAAPRQPLFELAYFWGLGGTLQALITPDLGRGFPAWEYVQFFLGHGLVLLAVAYLLGMGMRPRRGAALRAFAWLNVYVLVVGSLDLVFGWNYGYLMRKPIGSSILDPLGPWPWYVLGGEVIALMTFLALEWPWRGRRQPG